MNGREMRRQTSAKQTNAKQAGQPSKQMVKNADRRLPPKQQKAVEATTAKMSKTTSIKLRSNINQRISREFRFIQFV